LQSLPPEIVADLGELLVELEADGVQATSGEYSRESFGNYTVEFRSNKGLFRVVRDRSQYYIDGPSQDQLLPLGLWRAFNDLETFSEALHGWLARREA
jgi:hypothetical protein